MSTTFDADLSKVGAPTSVASGEAGHQHALRRRLKVHHVVCLAMADASPAMAVLLLTAGVFQVGGTFAVGSMLILSAIVILIAMCLGELSSAFPSTGGSYSIVNAVLPKPFAWITLLNFILQGVVIPSAVLLGIPIFLKHLFPWITLPNEVIALGLLMVSGGIAITKVEIGASVNIAILIVQLIVVGLIVLAACIAPMQDPLAVLTHPVVLDQGVLVPVTFAIGLATLAPAFNVLNGYDAVCGFVEEMEGGARDVGKAVISAAILASILITVPLYAGVIAAPDLTSFLQSDAPIVMAVEHALGPWASTMVDIGVIAALFNAALTLQMYFARGVFASARDGMWPKAISAKLAQLNRYRSPGWGVVALILPSTVLILTTNLDWLILFAGTMIATVYFFVALAALVSRITQKATQRPYRMPFWPLPPLIVIGFTGYALLAQTPDFLIGELVLAGIALIFWALSRRNKTQI